MPTFGERVINEALKHVHAPYIWGGKGDVIWSSLGMVSPGSETTGPHSLVFDCSGLVTYCIKQAGGPDWRPTFAAQTLYDKLKSTCQFITDLEFYGKHETAITHVALRISEQWVVEAAGGSRDCTTYLNTTGAVRAGLRQRKDVVGYGCLSNIQRLGLLTTP